MDIEHYSREYRHFYSTYVPAQLLKVLKESQWQTFLDAGCGDGSFLFTLNQLGYFRNKKVYAVDSSQFRIDHVKKINENFSCFVSDVCDMRNISDNSIDFLVATQVIEHVQHDEDMIHEITRVLKKNGILYLSTVFKKRHGWYFYRNKGKWVLDPTHLREYTQDEQLINLLQKNHCSVIHHYKTLFRFPLLDIFMRTRKADLNIYKSKFWSFLRKVSIPIFGYYEWVLICRR